MYRQADKFDCYCMENSMMAVMSEPKGGFPLHGILQASAASQHEV